MKKKQMKVQQRAYIIYLDFSPKASKRPLNAKALCVRVCECAVSEAANLLSKPIINCNKCLLWLREDPDSYIKSICMEQHCARQDRDFHFR